MTVVASLVAYAWITGYTSTQTSTTTSTQTSPSVIVFSDGFECPPNAAPHNFTAWSYSEGTCSIQSGTVHSGSYAAYFQNHLGGSWNSVTATIPDSSNLYLRAYVRFSTLSKSSQYILAFTDATDSSPIALAGTSDGTHWQCWVQNGYTFTSVATTINPDQWYCMELYVKIGAGLSGAAYLYINGVKVAGSTGIRTSAAGNIFHVAVGAIEGGEYNVYIDDVVASNGYVGP